MVIRNNYCMESIHQSSSLTKRLLSLQREGDSGGEGCGLCEEVEVATGKRQRYRLIQLNTHL